MEVNDTFMVTRVALRGAQRPLRAAASVPGRSSPVPAGSIAFSWAEFPDLTFSRLWGTAGLAPLVGACGP